MIAKSHEIYHRDDFPLLCMWRGLYTAVEVGVDRGHYSDTFMRRWYLGEKYVGIDNYDTYEDFDDRKISRGIAEEVYGKFPIGELLVEDSSVVSARMRESGHQFGFVYIDACHDHASVARDIAEWWPLVGHGGILAGHDFDDTHPGVVASVCEFAERHGQDIFLTWIDGPTVSWYTYKGGLPGPDWRRLNPEVPVVV